MLEPDEGKLSRPVLRRGSGRNPASLSRHPIIAHEIGVADTIDPFGGSYYLEKLTDELEQRVYEYFHKLDDL